MIRRLIIAALLVGCTTFVSARAWIAQVPAAAVAYTGPGDIVTSASSWYGLRAYSSATRGTNAVRLCNGGVCANVISDASTGIIPNAPTINGSACNNTTHICTVQTLYDQSGNANDVTQATTVNQPTWVVSCFTGLPCLGFVNATNQWVANATNATNLTQTYEMVVVSERTGDTGLSLSSFGAADTLGGNWANIEFFGVANSIVCKSGNFINPSATDSVWHVFQFKANGVSSDCNIDNTANTGDAGANSLNLRLAVGATNYLGGSSCTCRIVEAGVWPVGFTSGNVSSINSNSKAFWGF